MPTTLEQPFSKRSWSAISLAIAAGLLAIASVTGRLQPHLVPDSPSYLDYSFASARDMAQSIRTPGYPAWLHLATTLTPSRSAALQLVVVMHVLLHAVAVTCFAVELTRWRLAPAISVAAGLAVAIGCPFWDHVATIATDCPAMSIGVLTGTAVLNAWRRGLSTRSAVTISLLSLLAVALRPAYLFLIPWAAVMMLVRPVDCAQRRWRGRGIDMLKVLLPATAGILLWCTFRYAAVGDFGVLPFGHQNMAAVTTQLLDADELASLPGASGTLGEEIARRRIALAAESPQALDAHTVDALDLRPAADAASRADAYMTIENRWDAMTYLVVIPAAYEVVGQDILAQHQELARLDREIVARYPLRYLRWLGLAVRRGVWGSLADIAMHPIFFATILLASLLAVIHTAGWPIGIWGPAWFGDGSLIGYGVLRPLMYLAISYAFAKITFVGLTSPPIGRFSDAAAVWIPAWLAAALATWLIRAGTCRHPVSRAGGSS